MDRLPNPEQLAKEMAEFCKQVIKSVANAAPPALVVVVVALTGLNVDGPNKGNSFWSSKP